MIITVPLIVYSMMLGTVGTANVDEKGVAVNVAFWSRYSYLQRMTDMCEFEYRKLPHPHVMMTAVRATESR